MTVNKFYTDGNLVDSKQILLYDGNIVDSKHVLHYDGNTDDSKHVLHSDGNLIDSKHSWKSTSFTQWRYIVDKKQVLLYKNT